MFLVFSLLLMSLWIGMFISTYSSFFPFFQNIKNIDEYNVAYYAAVSALERGMLVTKYRLPGFNGQWWVKNGSGVAGSPVADTASFAEGRLQGSRRSVRSRTKSIPNLWEGNTDPLLDSGTLRDYNALGYWLSEKFLFSIDSGDSENAYTRPEESDITHYGGGISWELRLAPKVSATFAAEDNGGGVEKLCDEDGNPTCDLDGDGIYDEVKVNRNLQGERSWASFSIIPTLGVLYYQWNQINYPYDNAIRASLINDVAKLDITNNYSLFVNGENTYGALLEKHTVISSQADSIEKISFQDMLTEDTKNMQLSLGLVSWLRSFQWSIYPYLEYQLHFGSPIADRFFTIEWHGINRDYDIKIQVKKPTVRGTVAGDFTIIF